MSPVIIIMQHAITDELRQKSFLVLIGVCVLFVILLRSCYHGNVSVNGQTLDTLTLAWHASIAAYHIVCAFGLLIAALLASRVLRRDAGDGCMVFYLSRPVQRHEYLLGKLAAIAVLSLGCTFLLHTVIFLLTLTFTGGALPGLLTASLVTGLNVLFMTSLLFLLTQYMPDFIALVIAVIVVVVGYISDFFLQLAESPLGQSLAGGSTPTPGLWQVLWPKIGALQNYGASLVNGKEFIFPGIVHPSINILLFTLLCGGLAVLSFRRRDV